MIPTYLSPAPALISSLNSNCLLDISIWIAHRHLRFNSIEPELLIFPWTCSLFPMYVNGMRICPVVQDQNPRPCFALLFSSLLPFTTSASPVRVFTRYDCVHFFATPLLPCQGHQHQVLLGLCQLPPEWLPCFHHCFPHSMIHLPHWGWNDCIKNVYQALIHLKQESM